MFQPVGIPPSPLDHVDAIDGSGWNVPVGETFVSHPQVQFDADMSVARQVISLMSWQPLNMFLQQYCFNVFAGNSGAVAKDVH